MVRIIRLPFWYETWMNAGSHGSDDDTVVQKRRDIAKELLESLKEARLDAQTLEELTQVIDHECLCYRTTSEGSGIVSAHRPALQKPWTAKLVTELSECLFQVIYQESHYERELQARALFSGLALQRAQKTEAFEPGYHQGVRSRFERGYKELQWHQRWAGSFSREKFRKFQCSYLLCACAEYMRGFDIARPVMAEAISRTINLILTGGSLVMAVTTGWGPGSLQSIIDTLDNTFRPLSESQDKKSEELFGLQELTRVTLAAYLYNQVVASCKAGKPDDEDKPGLLADWILKRILKILSRYPKFETSVSCPKPMWEYVLAFFNRGPPSFDEYFYLYGLLDCATQLARVVGYNQLPQPLTERMEMVIQDSKEDSFRWKALEFLLSDPKDRHTRASRITSNFVRIFPKLQDEISVIKECLSEEEAMTSSPHRSSPSLKLPPTLSFRELEVKLEPKDWIEETSDIGHMDIHTRTNIFNIPLDRGKRRFPRRSIAYFSSGLSPNCRSSFFLSNNSIVIYPVDSTNSRAQHILRLSSEKKNEYKDAKVAISNNLLAIITDERLTVYKYGSGTAEDSLVGTLNFDGWDPTCLTIHAANDRTWICVGGRVAQAGSIRVYLVEEGNGKPILYRQRVHFDRPAPDPLIGDFPKMVNFSHDAGRLACLTNNNSILVWFLSNNARPRQAPFRITKAYRRATGARGMECAVLFQWETSKHPYLLCTTSPSNERESFGGEWPFVCPVALGPAIVPPELEHPFDKLEKSNAIHVGAVSRDGSVAALWDAAGHIFLVGLSPFDGGGLENARKPVKLGEKLKRSRHSMSPTSLRFYKGTDGYLQLYAVDVKGTVLQQRIEYRPD